MCLRIYFDMYLQGWAVSKDRRVSSTAYKGKVLAVLPDKDAALTFSESLREEQPEIYADLPIQVS